MGKRSTSRRIAMQAIYQAYASNISLEDALQNIFEQETFIAETKKFATQLAKDSFKHKAEIDAIIKKYSKNWELDRMNKVDVSVLRLAMFELSHSDIPPSIVINEAIELAKKYSTAESAKFVNGILGAYVKDR